MKSSWFSSVVALEIAEASPAVGHASVVVADVSMVDTHANAHQTQGFPNEQVLS